MRCTCANCGNSDFDTLLFRRFTTYCSVCGHSTHTVTGIDTRKYKIALAILRLVTLIGLSVLAFFTVPFSEAQRLRMVWIRRFL